MSRSISIDVKLASDQKISACSIIETLIKLGWNPIIDGSINYLPINDNDMYNWTKEQMSVNQLLEISEIKERNKEVIGVDMYWDDSSIGICLLIFDSGNISFDLSINRKYIDESIQLIDFNWYASKILPGLYNEYNVTYYKLEFFY